MGYTVNVTLEYGPRLDFMISTDHNTPASHGVWGPLAGNDLLILTGEEVTTRNGHYLAFGLEPGEWIDWRYRARDKGFEQEAQRIHASGGLVVPAHPYCPSVACRWKFGYDDADAVEVWTGRWTADDEYAINSWDSMLAPSVRTGGHWLPAMGNSDAHSAPQVIGFPHNVVNAAALSRTAILDGIRRRRGGTTRCRAGCPGNGHGEDLRRAQRRGPLHHRRRPNPADHPSGLGPGHQHLDHDSPARSLRPGGGAPPDGRRHPE
ncbi:CehA/McbA family metallohydrolase [Arthrobacter sp. SO3]|uniref:CehA/McbA family metallohydrolase n=1 Tax=Arthrobacter sp. SO3 TaxID=1897057 RepID=UPI001CFFF39F|nr:CehA/McbA family metallohydrolase [Arthrobacter sp. SO3]